jgi:hypothetical protein
MISSGGFETPEDKKAAMLKMLGGHMMRNGGVKQNEQKTNSAAAADIIMSGIGGYLAAGGKFKLGGKPNMTPMDAGISPIGNFGANGMGGVA